MMWGGRQRESVYVWAPHTPLSCCRLTSDPGWLQPPPTTLFLLFSSPLLSAWCVAVCRERWKEEKRETKKWALWDEHTTLWQKGDKSREKSRLGRIRGLGSGEKNREKYRGCKVWPSAGERERFESEKEAGSRRQLWETKIRADQQSTSTPSIFRLAFTSSSHPLFQSHSSLDSLTLLSPFSHHRAASCVFFVIELSTSTLLNTHTNFILHSHTHTSLHKIYSECDWNVLPGNSSTLLQFRG